MTGLIFHLMPAEFLAIDHPLMSANEFIMPLLCELPVDLRAADFTGQTLDVNCVFNHRQP